MYHLSFFLYITYHLVWYKWHTYYLGWVVYTTNNADKSKIW